MTLTPARFLGGRGGYLKGETFPRVPLVRMGGLAPPVAKFFRPAGAFARSGSGPALADGSCCSAFQVAAWASELGRDSLGTSEP